MRTRAASTDTVLWLLSVQACAPSHGSLDASAPTRGSNEVSNPFRCESRYARGPSGSERAPDFSRRVQQALAQRYPSPEAIYPENFGPRELRDKLQFVLIDKRWGADGPVPWTEVSVPALERFLGPVVLYRTEFWTWQFEYPWVEGLVVAKENPKDEDDSKRRAATCSQSLTERRSRSRP